MTASVPDLSSSFADLVARLRRAMRRSARTRQPFMPLSVAQLELLSVIEEHPGSRPGELAQILRLAPNSVSTLANALAGAGMLQRASSRADKRAVEYSLTPAGAGYVSDWRETNSASLAAAVVALTSEERQIMTVALPVLNRLVSLLDEQTDQATHSEEPNDGQIH